MEIPGQDPERLVWKDAVAEELCEEIEGNKPPG